MTDLQKKFVLKATEEKILGEIATFPEEFKRQMDGTSINDFNMAAALCMDLLHDIRVYNELSREFKK